MSERYDPGADAARRYPEWTIRRRPLGDVIHAVLSVRHRLVLVDRGLSLVGWRCTVAHEVAHLDAGHGDAELPPLLIAKAEETVDRVAAKRLVSLDALLDANLWGRHPAEVADELDVDLDTLKVRVANLTQQEKDYINGRLADREDVA